MTGPTALSLQDIRVRYGDIVAVDGVTLEVHRGEIVGLLGPNGSGKSTTLATAAGVLEPVSGRVTVEGICRRSDPAGFAKRIGLVPQEHAHYDELTASENLKFFGRLYSLSGRDLERRVQRVLASCGLADRASERAGNFSGGLKQKLNLAVALLHEPTVLLLDEPTAALDPASRDAFFARLTRLREEGHAVLLTTHHLDEAEQGCDRIVVLDRGRVIATGRPSELLHPPIAGKTVIFGHLRDPLPKFLERSLRKRLASYAMIEVTGRRVRLAAATCEELGRALALILAEGVALETFRTPPAALERVLRSGSRVEMGEPCDIGSP